MGDGGSEPQQETSSLDLSGSRWRQARARRAIVNPAAPYGLRPSSGLLAGSGDDRLYLAIDGMRPCGDVDGNSLVGLGDRGFLLALLDWGRSRGVRTAPWCEALLRSGPPVTVPLPAFRHLIDDVQQACTVGDQSGWGLFPSESANQPLRVLLPTEPATILLATPTAAVGVGSTGLYLIKRRTVLTGWSNTERGLILTTPDGQRCLRTASLSAQLLSRVGRDAPQIDLRRVSLSAMLTRILNCLNDLAEGSVGRIGDRTCFAASSEES